MRNDEGTITGDPDTGRWEFKYKNKVHRFPGTAKSANDEVPDKVVDWAGEIVADGLISEAFG